MTIKHLPGLAIALLLHWNREHKKSGNIKKAALEAGLQTLRMDGARKVLAGITTIPEVLRVTQADVM